jgi:hypothetical protein
MAKESVPLPLNVSEVTEDERFLKVKLGGETIWLNKKQVTVLRSVSAGCLAHVTAPTEAATTRGANNGCGK